jgi:hypothetical protein
MLCRKFDFALFAFLLFTSLAVVMLSPAWAVSPH